MRLESFLKPGRHRENKLIYFFYVCSWFSCCILCNKSICQNISGHVVTFHGKIPIAYVSVTVKNKNVGVYTNEMGNFVLEKISVNDTLKFSSVGFENLEIVVSKLRNKNVITLKEVTYQLPSVIINKSDYTIESHGSPREATSDFYVNAGPHANEVAHYIDFQSFSDTSKTYIVNTVGFFIGKTGSFRAPFRVRLYDVDPIIKQPGNDLLLNEVIAKAKRKGTWLSIDLSKFNIRVPKAGMYVSMEWLYGSDEKHFYTVKINDIKTGGYIEKKYYGQELGLSIETNAIAFQRANGKNWKRLNTFKHNDSTKQLFPMIRITTFKYHE